MNNKKYDAVIFDLDGTLLNTLDDLHESVNYALKKQGMKERTREEIRHFVGNGVENLMIRAIPGGRQNPDFENTFRVFKEYYKSHCNDRTGLYDGIRELLAELKKYGVKMAIVSNKYQEGVSILKEQYFKDFMEVAIGEKPGVRKKPAPDTVNEALRQLEIARDRAVYVGDSEVDIETARNSEMDCIAVTWGFRTKAEQIKAGGAIFADSPMQIMKIILSGVGS